MVPDIIEGLKSQKTEVRTRAAGWLAELGSTAKPALPALLQGLQSGPKKKTNSETRHTSSAIIASTGGSSGMIDEEESAWLAELDALRRISAEPRKLIPLLVRVVADRTRPPICRTAAANILREFGVQAKEAAPVLLKVFANDVEPDEIRSSALRAMEQIGVDSRQVVPLLIKEIERYMEVHTKENWFADDLTAQSMAYLTKLRPQPRKTMPMLIHALKQYDHDEKLRPLIAQRWER